MLDARPADRLPDDVRTPPPRGGAGWRRVESPVSRAETADLTAPEIARLFDGSPDGTGARHPRDGTAGRSVQLSGEFEEFAKADPCRAADVLALLRPGVQERPAAHGSRGLVAADRPAAEVAALVRQLDARGFAGGEFRSTVAFALCELARDGGLPEPARELLDRWRVADWPDGGWAGACGGEAAGPRRPTSILWGHGGTVALPHGRFPVLSAPTRGYPYRRPPAADRWLAMLSDHVERDESVACWRAMCLHLRDLRYCPDRDQAGAFLGRLFVRFPEVVTCDPGASLLARVAPLLPDDARRRAYTTTLGWDPDRGPQAFGELVGLRHLLHPEDGWARGQVEAALGGSPGAGCERVCVGVAFAAANLWGEPRARGRATEVLCRLPARPSGPAGSAALSVFRTTSAAKSVASGGSWRRPSAAGRVRGSW